MALENTKFTSIVNLSSYIVWLDAYDLERYNYFYKAVYRRKTKIKGDSVVK